MLGWSRLETGRQPVAPDERESPMGASHRKEKYAKTPNDWAVSPGVVVTGRGASGRGGDLGQHHPVPGEERDRRHVLRPAARAQRSVDDGGGRGEGQPDVDRAFLRASAAGSALRRRG